MKLKTTKTKQFTKKERRIFDLEENLRSIIRDLEFIAHSAPCESARYGCLMDSKTQGEEMAIVEARKNQLLDYIRVICNDHLIWSKKLMNGKI